MRSDAILLRILTTFETFNRFSDVFVRSYVDLLRFWIAFVVYLTSIRRVCAIGYKFASHFDDL